MGVEGPADFLSFTVVNNANIVQLAQQTPDLSILVDAVVKAELVDALSADGPLTVFAPDNAAFHHLFEVLGIKGIEDLSKEELTPILLYHVLSGQFLSTDLDAGQIVPTRNGGSAVVLKDETGVTVNGSHVVNPDLVATNGVIHVIDKVLLPPSDAVDSESAASRAFEVNAYPNPAIDRLTINPLQNQFSNTTDVVIYHTEGKIYYEGQLSRENNGQLNINVANYPTGIYLIKLQSGSQNKTIRLYKK